MGAAMSVAAGVEIESSDELLDISLIDATARMAAVVETTSRPLSAEILAGGSRQWPHWQSCSSRSSRGQAPNAPLDPSKP